MKRFCANTIPPDIPRFSWLFFAQLRIIRQEYEKQENARRTCPTGLREDEVQILKQREKEDRKNYCGEPTLSPLWCFFSRWVHFPIRWDSLSSFLWRVTTEMKENLILSYLKKKVSLCAFVNPKIPPSFQRTMCFDSSYHASGSDPVKWWGNPFKTARAELGENGKMYFTTDFFLEQSLQKDFKSYIKHCFDSMCFWYVIQFPRTQLTSIFEGQQGQISNENKGHLASRYIFLLGYSPSQ